ncbi:hypothetical protein B7463_g8245, partial [Scytalidium lignicola]
MKPSIPPSSSGHGTTKTSSPPISLASGATAGGVEGLVTYPFEFAKTSVQQRSNYGSSNPIRVILQVVRSQGPGALYVGCSSMVLGTVVKDGVRFLCYDSIKARLAGQSGSVSLIGGIIAGMGAGVAESVLAVTPSERIKTALIDDARGQKRLRNGLHAVSFIVRNQGLAGLYQGLAATTMKQAATSAVRMGSYNALKELTRRAGWKGNTATTFLMGACAGAVTMYATQPLDSIKTRSQALGAAGTWRAFQDIVRDHGVWGLWRGSTMRLGRLLMGGGIVFSVYENVHSLYSDIAARGTVAP